MQDDTDAITLYSNEKAKNVKLCRAYSKNQKYSVSKINKKIFGYANFLSYTCWKVNFVNRSKSFAKCIVEKRICKPSDWS